MSATLRNPTDAQLDAAFAKHVAGWHNIRRTNFSGEHYLHTKLDGSVDDMGNPYFRVPPFTRSADAVLPWLEKHTWRGCSYCSPGGDHRSATVEVVGPGLKLITAQFDTLPRAAVIALLRAHGVTVAFDT